MVLYAVPHMGSEANAAHDVTRLQISIATCTLHEGGRVSSTMTSHFLIRGPEERSISTSRRIFRCGERGKLEGIGHATPHAPSFDIFVASPPIVHDARSPVGANPPGGRSTGALRSLNFTDAMRQWHIAVLVAGQLLGK